MHAGGRFVAKLGLVFSEGVESDAESLTDESLAGSFHVVHDCLPLQLLWYDASFTVTAETNTMRSVFRQSHGPLAANGGGFVVDIRDY